MTEQVITDPHQSYDFPLMNRLPRCMLIRPGRCWWSKTPQQQQQQTYATTTTFYCTGTHLHSLDVRYESSQWSPYDTFSQSQNILPREHFSWLLVLDGPRREPAAPAQWAGLWGLWTVVSSCSLWLSFVSTGHYFHDDFFLSFFFFFFLPWMDEGSSIPQPFPCHQVSLSFYTFSVILILNLCVPVQYIFTPSRFNYVPMVFNADTGSSTNSYNIAIISLSVTHTNVILLTYWVSELTRKKI